ncbi:MAG: PDZ domain-containing protein [Longimicrobiales bacterium]
MSMRFSLGSWALVLLSFAALPGVAQEASNPVSVVQSARGWVGVDVEMQYTVTPRTGQDGFRILVADVLEGSPADLAGVRPGDQITALDGNAVSQDRWMRSLIGITPGDQLRISVVRAGGEVGELTVTAGIRPPSADRRGTAEAFALARARMFRSIDSLLVVTTRNLTNRGPGQELRVFIRSQDRDDSLQILARGVEEQVRAIEGPTNSPPGLRRVTGQNSRTPWILAPRIVGDAFILGGAQARDVSGGLAEYFGVEEGVLITDVVQQSPAAQVGLLPCDVILSVGGQPASSVTQLRATLNRLSVPFTLEVRRKGETRTLRYPNQQ